MAFLLDTGVVSELRRPTPDGGLTRWLEGVRAEDVYLSCLVLVELRAVSERLRSSDAATAGQLDSWLDGLSSAFADRVLPVDVAVADRWGRLNGQWSLNATEGLMAATAAVHGLTIVTRDPASLAGLDVAVLNPFTLN